jgi:multidrug efflux pump subunit AcrA (membrane-fusion protein)
MTVVGTALRRGRLARGVASPTSRRQPRFRSALAGFRHATLRPAVVIPLLAVAVAGGWYLARSSTPSAGATTTVEQTAVATTGPMSQAVSASGTLMPAATDNLNFATSGVVTAVNVQAGQHVAKGAVLATIDSAALQSQVVQAQATVASAAARLSSDQSAGASAAQLTADQANVTAADAGLTSAQTSLAGATLTSPIDGKVASVNLTVGQQLGAGGTSGSSVTGAATGSGRSSAGSSGTSATSGTNGTSTSTASSTAQIQVISAGSYIVNLGVDDTQIGRIAQGQVATVTPSSATTGTGGTRNRAGATGATGTGTPSPVAGTTNATTATPTASGTVSSVGAIASSSSGVSSFPVVVTLTGSPTGFYPGATVQVDITYNQLANVLRVPSAAVTQTNGVSFVTLTQNGKKVQRAVTTGIVAGGQTQILSGLSAGDQVTITITTRAAGSTNTNGTTGNRTVGGGAGGGFGGGTGGPPGGFRPAGG